MIPIFLLLLAQQLPGPPPLAWGFPCSFDPSRMCEVFEMVIDEKPSAFIDPKFKTAHDAAVCQGKLISGSFRYFVNGTSPSSLVGTLVPQILNQIEDPTGTLEQEGNIILLYDKKAILGFKATQANWGGAVLTWECSLQ